VFSTFEIGTFQRFGSLAATNISGVYIFVYACCGIYERVYNGFPLEPAKDIHSPLNK
jgi:hypothetical protein